MYQSPALRSTAASQAVLRLLACGPTGWWTHQISSRPKQCMEQQDGVMRGKEMAVSL